MDEQQINEGLLCDADRQLIASAARLQKYVEAPVPELHPNSWTG